MHGVVRPCWKNAGFLKPSTDGVFELWWQPGDAVLDGDSFRAAAIDQLPRGDAQRPGKLFDLDATVSHGMVPRLTARRRILPAHSNAGTGPALRGSWSCRQPRGFRPREDRLDTYVWITNNSVSR